MIKLPIFNNHKCNGLYECIKILPEHYSWISHLLIGFLSCIFPLLTYLFIVYQVSQMVIKIKFWDDFVDIVEFYIGNTIFSYFI